MNEHNNFGLFFLVLWPFLAAFISYLIGRSNKTARNYFANFAVVLEFLAAILVAITSASNTNPPTFQLMGFMGARIYLTMDGFRCVYAVITALMWMMTTIFSREYFAHYRNRNRYYFFMLLTQGGTMGVFLSGDLVTTFLFFEMMSFTSYVMVLHDEKPRALTASKTYMAVAVIGGLAMVFGIFIINDQLGTTEISKLFAAARAFEGNRNMLYLAAAFMLVGFGGKAGMYPIHIWLPNAHPVAPAPASALLSGVLTKTGIYGIIIMSVFLFFQDFNWGMLMLCIGLIGMFTGALLALFSIDLKRTLACSSVSQIGFIMVGIGMQLLLTTRASTARYSIMAIQGTLLHMVNHSLIKLVLFMMAGVVYMNLHELDLNKIRGFGRGKPIFIFAFLMGVMGIIGIPHWNGYISKTLLHETLVYTIHYYYAYNQMVRFYQIAESIFTFTGGLTTAYMIKIFVCVCIEKNRFHQEKLTALNKTYMTPVSGAVLFICGLILPVLGFSPYTFMIPIANLGKVFMLPTYVYNVHFFAWVNVKGAVASLGIGTIIYILVVRGILMGKDKEGRSVYLNLWPGFIDIENKIYKPLLLGLLPFIGAFVARSIGSLVTIVSETGFKCFIRFRDFFREQVAIAATPGSDLDNARLFIDEKGKAKFDAAPVRVAYETYGQKATSIAGTVGTVTRAGFEEGLSQVSHVITPFLEGEALMEVAQPKSQKWYTRLLHWYRIQSDKLFGLVFATFKKDRVTGEIFKTVFNSLAYSMMLFLLGAIVIVVFGVFN